jgi:hypothetical protein
VREGRGLLDFTPLKFRFHEEKKPQEGLIKVEGGEVIISCYASPLDELDEVAEF